MISVTLPDGSRRDLPEGSTIGDLAYAIGPRLGAAAVAAEVNGELVDLGVVLEADENVRIVADDTAEGTHVLRHSTAHVLAQAVLELFPGAKYAIGPAIADGFYYDFDLPGGAHFTDDDLPRIEEKMREIIAEDQPFVREEHTLAEGLELFSDQPYKTEIIERVGVAGDSDEELSDELATGASEVSAYRNNDHFVDLCRGPHVPSTGRLGHFKLMRVAGAYWRGDEHRPQLQRIYGTAFATEKELAEHLARLEQASLRDHRKLGVELDLFSFPDEIGSGLAVFHPKGGLIRRVMEEYSRKRHEEAGYDFVNTPHISKSELFEISGHLDWFSEGMFPPMELDGDHRYYLKPMNCPFHILIFRSRQRSYRELPMRLFEFGSVYRYEKSGVIHGLTRVRGMTQDDAHIFCTREQMDDELHSLLEFVLTLLRDYGLEDFYLEISTKPPGKAVGTDEEWDEATDALFRAAARMDLELTLDEGGGAFYGPKISVQARDAIGRAWQLSTIQVDFQLPQRFGLSYIGADNSRHQPIMLHRALFGSIERFFAVLLEHYAGAFPTWLSPVQARVLAVRDDNEAYAGEVLEMLRSRGVRADTDQAVTPLGRRIRDAKVEHVPYVLVVGADDVAARTVGVNARGSGDPERGVPLESFLERITTEIAERSSPERQVRDVTLERLWAGWRSDYVNSFSAVAASGADAEQAPDGGCVFCAIAESKAPDDERYVIHQGDQAMTLLNAYPYASGHLLVMPVRHVAEPEELDAAESADLWSEVQLALGAVRGAYAPDGVNLGANLGRAGGAGIPGHLHFHVLPRWIGDTNFMTTIASVRVLPEALSESFVKLRASWPE